MFTRRILFGIVLTWFLLEGSKGLWKQWGKLHAGEAGIRGMLAEDVLEVTR